MTQFEVFRDKLQTETNFEEQFIAKTIFGEENTEWVGILQGSHHFGIEYEVDNIVGNN